MLIKIPKRLSSRTPASRLLEMLRLPESVPERSWRDVLVASMCESDGPSFECKNDLTPAHVRALEPG